MSTDVVTDVASSWWPGVFRPFAHLVLVSDNERTLTMRGCEVRFARCGAACQPPITPDAVARLRRCPECVDIDAARTD